MNSTFCDQPENAVEMSWGVALHIWLRSRLFPETLLSVKIENACKRMETMQMLRLRLIESPEHFCIFSNQSRMEHEPITQKPSSSAPLRSLLASFLNLPGPEQTYDADEHAPCWDAWWPRPYCYSIVKYNQNKIKNIFLASSFCSRQMLAP